MKPSPAARFASAGVVGLGVLFASAQPTPAPDASPNAPPAVRAGYETAANEVLCYCGCARLTVKDCTCGVAFNLRDAWEARLSHGETADAIITAYLAEHGEQARNVPPHKGLNLLAWFGPGIAISLAAGATILVIVVWSSRGRNAAPVPVSFPGGGKASEIEKRLEQDLKEFDA